MAKAMTARRTIVIWTLSWFVLAMVHGRGPALGRCLSAHRMTDLRQSLNLSGDFLEIGEGNRATDYKQDCPIRRARGIFQRIGREYRLPVFNGMRTWSFLAYPA
jgi:hypothetical protein